ncbi:hypothetical protein POTOM_034902 [Populus tomentosa]|uniref:beta-galactosidase n=1 Tax=Populus tomentosa TaxID=118781 RepID=A0A8X7Z7X8_POPTO|nr:hypothetical protein POTOM_034902 [Populus tomentosa]
MSHEFNFEGPYDLVKFIKTIGENGMFATLRLGPFIQAEWNHGFRVFGDPPSQRSAEDTAFSVARWFSKNGSLVNYYMARFYEQPGTKVCAAFLASNNSKEAETVKFRGQEYYLPARSISILPDCKTVVYNTMTVVSQHNSRNFVKSRKKNKLEWNMYSETIPAQLQVDSSLPKELYNLTKDKTDYVWFTTTINVDRRDMNERKRINPVLRVASLGHAMVAFVNGEFIGSAHGSQIEKSFVLQHSVDLKPGINFVTLLGTLVGLPDSGAYMEHRYAGPRGVSILGLNTGTLDLTSNGWGHQVGLSGETAKLFTKEGGGKVTWTKLQKAGPPVTWYKTHFDAPEGKSPVAVRMTGMNKGMIWINGKSIGRYWMTYVSPLGEPTQSEYHIPRSYLKPTDNLMVIFEEEEANPEKIEILTVNRDTICSYVTEYHPPSVKSWERKNNKFTPVVDNAKPAAHLKCPNQKKIIAHCLGKTSCDIPIDKGLFAGKKDDCPVIRKTLAVQVKCSNKDPKRSAN